MGGGGRVAVVIPWRGGCPHREAALGAVRARWRAAGHETVIGEAPAGPWCKALAVADALSYMHVAVDVLVVADADVWTDGTEQAVDAVLAGAPWAIPHDPVHRLDQDATAALLAGGALGGRLSQPSYRGFEGGGITVLPRNLYDQVPLDRRFADWGQEDESWALALRTLAGAPWRGTAPLWHLWHPPQPRQSRRWGSPAARALNHRYRTATGRPDAMRALLDEMEVTDAAAAGDRR